MFFAPYNTAIIITTRVVDSVATGLAISRYPGLRIEIVIWLILVWLYGLATEYGSPEYFHTWLYGLELTLHVRWVLRLHRLIEPTRGR